MSKMKLRRSQMVLYMNHSIERGFIEAKRLEGWTERQIKRSIEKLDHLQAAHDAIEEERRKLLSEQENDNEPKGVE